MGRSGLTGLRTPLTLSRMVKGCLRPFIMRSLIRKSCGQHTEPLLESFSLSPHALGSFILCPGNYKTIAWALAAAKGATVLMHGAISARLQALVLNNGQSPHAYGCLGLWHDDRQARQTHNAAY